MLKELDRELTGADSYISELETRTLLSGETDHLNAIMLKNPSYSGITTDFWNSCDAICGKEFWTLWGTPNCGKGQPMQTMGTGHGAAPARFRNVKMGTAFSGH